MAVNDLITLFKKIFQEFKMIYELLNSNLIAFPRFVLLRDYVCKLWRVFFFQGVLLLGFSYQQGLQ